MARILITRSPHQASELADRLRAVGVEPILIPTIELVEPSSFAALDDALGRMEGFDWLIFTSANAVEAFGKRAGGASKDKYGDPSTAAQRRAFAQDDGVGGASDDVRAEARTLQTEARTLQDGLVAEGSGGMGGREQHGRSFDSARSAPLRMTNLKGLKIAAIGPATARAVSEVFGRGADLVPPQAVAESLAEALLPHVRQGIRFLLVRAEAARDHLPEALRAAGAEVTIAPAYRTVIPEGSAEKLKELFAERERWPDAITFTSSSTVTNLFALLKSAGVDLPEGILRASIGPITSQTLREVGYPAQVEAEEASVAGLVEAVVKALSERQKQKP